MTKYLRQVQVIDEYDRPVSGAQIYVFDGDGNNAQIYADEAGIVPLPLGEPITADEFGVVSYYGNASIYREDTHYGAKLRFKEITPVGLDGLYPPREDRAGSFFAFDADNNPVAASGTGADAGLRADLAANTGSTLIKYKNSDANAYGRSAAQLKALGAEDTDGLNFMHFVDPSYDDELLANAGIPNLDTAFTNALANLSAVQGSTGRNTRLLVPGFVYPVANTVSLNIPGLLLDARGATLQSSILTSASALGVSASDITIQGLRVLMALDDDPYVNVAGANCTLDGVTIEKPDGAGGIQLYLRQQADGFRMKNCTIKGSNGIGFAECSNVEIIGNRFIGRTAGGDDAIAIKSINVPSVGWRIIGNYFENLAAAVSIGSEIGVRGAADPSYSRYVRGVVVMGNTLKNCISIGYIKPGAVNMGVSAYDYRDGLVEAIVIKGNTLDDPSGTKFERAVAVTPGRGAKVRRLEIGPNTVTGRTTNSVGRHAGVADIYIVDSTGSLGTADASVSGVSLKGTFHDPWNGVANGVGGAPGYPIGNLVTVEKQNTAYGSVSDITFEIDGNGCSASGIVIQPSLDDAVYIKRAHLTNVGASGTGIVGGISVASRVKVGTDISITVSAAGQSPYLFHVAGSGDIVCPEYTDPVYLGTMAATATPSTAVLAEKGRCELIAIDMLTSNALAQDATNNTGLTLANLDLAGTGFGGWSSNTTGASGSNKRSAVVANTLTQLYHRRDVTVAADQAQALFARDGRLQIAKSFSGTGGALNDTRVRVRTAPY